MHVCFQKQQCWRYCDCLCGPNHFYINTSMKLQFNFGYMLILKDIIKVKELNLYTVVSTDGQASVLLF